MAKASGNWNNSAQASSQARNFNNQRYTINANNGSRSSICRIFGVLLPDKYITAELSSMDIKNPKYK